MTVDGQTVLFAAGELHALNSSAAAIWRACSGSATVAEIWQTLAREFGVDEPAMRHDVEQSIGELRARGLVTFGAGSGVSKPILEPVPVCASCGDGPEYERHVLVELPDARLAIGADAQVAAALVRALGARDVDVDDAPTARPSYGLVVPAHDGGGGLRALARLQRGPDVLIRGREAMRAIRGLVTLLGVHEVPGLLRLEATAVGDGDRVVLLAPPANPVRFERDATARGLMVAELAAVTIEDHAVRIGPPTAAAPVDLGAFDEVLAARGDAGRDPDALPWGLYPLAAIAVAGEATPLGAFAEVGPLLVDEPAPLAPIRDLCRAVPVHRGTSVDAIGDCLRAG
ncbi:MAG: HPr-rel-A system PqqD family peptide chaperone [Acidimicrobiia bacterium]